ncbi:MAG: hypothetical protein HQL66_10980 [Magnetococcales bacterium]|nr:hypothetical protein [Magnetococcales bacterium]
MSNQIFATLLRISLAASARLPAKLRPVMFPRDHEKREASSVPQRLPEEILRDILAWDKSDATMLCELLNAYDHLVLSGAPAPALDLRRVPSADPRSRFRFGTPVQFVAMDDAGRCVVRSGRPGRRRYAVQSVVDLGGNV